MNFVKFVLNQWYYSYHEASNVEMNTLGMFLSDIQCSKNSNSIFRDWAMANKNDPRSKFTHTCGTNVTALEEEDDGNIYITDATGNDPDDIHYIPPCITMTKEQFVQLLDDWQEKVCKHKPKEVTITYDNGQFNIQTNS